MTGEVRVVPAYWQRAKRELARRDPAIGGLIRAFPGIALRSRGDAFQTLARSIVGQQISVKAAESVWTRLAGAAAPFEPRAVLAAGPARLRECGLSARKVEYLLDLAQRFDQGAVRPDRWSAMDDEAVIAELAQVHGIGRWTAEMFLIFNLLRPDVLPVDDLGLRRAVSQHYAGGVPVPAAALRELAAQWRPWRSVATWYLWRSLDPVPVEY